MIRTSIPKLSIIWYCVFDASCHGVLGQTEGLAEPSSGDCLLQQRFDRAPQAAVNGRAHPVQEHHHASHPAHFSVLEAKASQRSSLANESTAAAAVDHAEIPHEDGTHHSIFELSFAQLDRTTFWFVFACMLIFTIIVDRTEKWASTKAENNPSEKMFLDRINSELMMFGCVGLFLFVLSNTADLPHDQELIVEFVDILCSMGACGLIAVAIVLLIMRMISSSKWKTLEAENIESELIKPTGPIEIKSFRKVFYLHTELQAMDFQVMAKRFIQQHSLPKNLLYSDYLNHTFARNACDLMDIKWYSWLVMLVLVLVLFAIRFCRGTHFPNFVYIIMFSGCNWLILIVFVGLLVTVNAAFCDLLTEVRKDQEDLQKEGLKMADKFTKKPKVTKVDPEVLAWSDRVRFLMEITSLFNSFLLSFFIMHLQFNLRAAGLFWLWKYFMLFPLIVSLFVLLPIIISRFSLVEASYGTNAEAIDDTLTMLNQLQEDLDCMRRTWKSAGEPHFPALEEGVDEEGFSKILEEVGVHIAKARKSRIFRALDDDKSGTITSAELMTRLTNENSARLDITSSMSVDVAEFAPPDSRSALENKQTFTFRNNA